MDRALETLTEKEKETLRLILRGHDAKSSARELDLSVHTINERLRNARRKLSVTSSREAARLLMESEGEPPNSLGYKQLGDDDGAGSADPSAMPTAGQADRAGPGRKGVWLIGGIAVMSLALVLAYALAPAAVGPDIAPNPDASLPAEAAPIQTDASEAAPQGEREAASVTLDPLERLARDWLQRVDARQWQGAFEASAMPSAIDLTTFRAAMEKEIVPLGKARKREFLEFGSVKSAGVDYRVARFTTDFANRRGVIETVTMIEGEDGYEVGGYFVDKSASRPPVSDATLEKAARSWLALVDRSDWQASYDAAGSAFQQPNTVEGWQQASELARVPLGKLIERTAIAFEDVNAPPGGYKIVRFRSDFENRKGVTETVTLEAEQGEWRTVGYFIS